MRAESRYREENLARYEILAPISGLIIEKAIAQGQTLKEDENIYTVADVSTVWAAITVYPRDLAVIRVGQEATVKATAIDVEGKGTVNYITALLEGQTRTATARVELENQDGRWRPGMFVNAELGSEEIQVPVAVSAEAIQTFATGPWCSAATAITWKHGRSSLGERWPHDRSAQGIIRGRKVRRRQQLCHQGRAGQIWRQPRPLRLTIMFERILRISIHQRGLVLIAVMGMAMLGIYSYQHLSIDAVPDITNVQVQINTRATGYSPIEAEQRSPFPSRR